MPELPLGPSSLDSRGKHPGAIDGAITISLYGEVESFANAKGL
jgi:hypothetical protein